MQALTYQPWLLDPRAAATILDAQRRVTNGERLASGRGGGSTKSQRGKLAIMYLSGMLAPHESELLEFVGGTSTARFGLEFDAAVRDPNISAIAILINSPGGTADGTPELADRIFAARGKKPIFALADSLAASAAFWIATSADRFFIVPSGETGSVGTIAVHLDHSGELAKAGIVPTIFRSPPAKAEWTGLEPLSDDARAFEQAQVEKMTRQFTEAVARNRGVGSAFVMQHFGRGRVVDADHALQNRMVDGVATEEQFFERLLTTMVSGNSRSLADDHLRRVAAARRRHESRMLQAEAEKTRRRLQARGVLPGGPPILRKLAGLVVAWNKPGQRTDGTWEAVTPEAFDSVLNGPGEVTFTQGHRYLQPIARRSEFQVELRKTREGLYAEVTLPDTAVARNLMREIERSGATGWSFTTRPGTDRHETRMIDGKIVNVLTRGELNEICVCVTPDQPTYRHGGVLVGAC